MPDPSPSARPVPATVLHRRRERVFLLLAGLFLGTLAMLNILGISRFIVLGSMGGDQGWQWGQAGKITFALAVGVLPYPLTFLCTDLISEFYGRRRANFVVWVGLILNLWVIFILWVGGLLPGFGDLDSQGKAVVDAAGRLPVFFEIRTLAFGAVTASMIAYLLAQFVDVYLFHFWKALTKGKHLWLRNNGSTMVSQMVDTTAVILITHFYARALPVAADQPIWPQLLLFIATGYAFKFVAAALDTPVIYLAVWWLKGYLQLNPNAEHEAEAEELALYSHAE